jgi:hypothetical protein
MMAASVSTEDLYKCYEILYNASGSVAKYQNEYESILDGIRGSTSLKRLVPSILVKFIHSFPSLHAKTLHCLCDLLEDADASVRLSAIKCLPEYATSCPAEVSKVADVLAQMLVTEDSVELIAVKRSLTSIVKANVRESMSGIFGQIASTDDSNVRSKTVQFVVYVIDTLSGEVFGRLQEINEKHVMMLVKEALCKLPQEENQILVDVVSHLHLCSTKKGIQLVVDLLAEVANLKGTFEGDQVDAVQRVIECTKEAVIWSQRGGIPTSFYSYIVQKVLPNIANVEEAAQHELLRLLTSLVTFDLPQAVLKDSTPPLQASIQEFIPVPTGSGDVVVQENWHFSIVECLLFTLHTVVRKVPNSISNEEQLKDLRSKLTFFSRGCQIYHSQLQKDLSGKTDKELLQQECKVKLQTKSAIDNLTALTRDFFHSPPSCKTVVKLSFVRFNPYDKNKKSKPIYTGRPFTGPTPTPISPGFDRKRTATPKGQTPEKVAKEGKPPITKIIYEPPKGTYSSKLSESDEKWSKAEEKTLYSKRGWGGGRGGRWRGGRGRGKKWSHGW